MDLFFLYFCQYYFSAYAVFVSHFKKYFSHLLKCISRLFTEASSTCLASWHFHRRSGSVCQQRLGMTWRGLGIFFQHLLLCSRLGWYFDTGNLGNVAIILSAQWFYRSVCVCLFYKFFFQRGNMGPWGRMVGFPVFLLFILPQLTQVEVLPYLHNSHSVRAMKVKHTLLIFHICSHDRRWVWAVEDLRSTHLKTKLFFWTRQTFRFLLVLKLWHILTRAMISANHMWIRTSMAGRILLKLVSRLLNQLLKLCHQEE